MISFWRRRRADPAPRSGRILDAIPRPSRRREFGGVLHIHGALPASRGASSEMVLTDRDFGEYYLRRRVVPDSIYDAARLFHLVVVGYSANDAPMRYLLNAVAAYSTRFPDLKERGPCFEQRRIRPSGRSFRLEGAGTAHRLFVRRSTSGAGAWSEALWADLSADNGKTTLIEKEVRRIVRYARNDASDHDRDLFDYVFRRGSQAERLQIARSRPIDACALSAGHGPHRDRARAVDEALIMTTIAFPEICLGTNASLICWRTTSFRRLEERATADWALALKPWQNAERAALQDAIWIAPLIP